MVTKIRKKAATSILIWLLLWSVTQGLFMNSKLMSIFMGTKFDSIFLVLIWIFLVTILCLFLFRKNIKKLFPINKYIWSYLAVPLAIFIRYFIIKPNSILAWPYFISMIIISVFWQDLLTFGFLRIQLNKLKIENSWILVAFVFWLGHVIFFIPTFSQNIISWLSLLLAALVLSWTAEKTESFYLSDVLHMVFLFLF